MADETKLTVVKSNVANALSSAAADHVIAVANDIYDEDLGEYQSVINQNIKSYSEGYGIEIQDDNTILAEVKYIHQDEEWIEQTWNGYTSIDGSYTWTDNNGVIHYDSGSIHYYLDDSDGITWKQQTWSGYTGSIYGIFIWTDNNGVSHYDYNSNHYYLDSDGVTWKQQTWNGYTSIDGRYIWRDCDGIIHFDDGSNHYYLDSDNKTWKAQTWNGYTAIDASHTWTDNNGVNHYDLNSRHYYLDSDGITWKQKTWNGYTSIDATCIWIDNNGVIHYDNNSRHYYLDSDGVTWKQKTWNGYTSIDATCVWIDNNGVIHYDYNSDHYYLQEGKDQYLTRHDDELQTKLTAGEGVSIKNGVISATVETQDLSTKQDKLTPGYGIEIDENNTILAEVKYIHQDEEWKVQTWDGYTGSINANQIWKDYNGTIHYDYSSDHYYLDSDGVTWKQQTWSGYTSINGAYTWTDNNGVIHYDIYSNHYYLDSDGVTWQEQTWNGLDSFEGMYIWKDTNGVIHFDDISNHYYLDSDGITWKVQTWNGYTSINCTLIWKDYNGVIHFDYSSNHYYLDSDNKTWKQQTWNGYTPYSSEYIWIDNNGVIHYDYNSNHYYLDSDGVTWKEQTWNGYTSINGKCIWIDNNGIIHYDQSSNHYYLQEGKGQYLTRHNDELQTKLIAGEGVSIKNGVISATVKNQDLSGYATESWVEDKGYLTEHQSLTEYAKKSELPTKVSNLTNDAGYLTEHQSLTEYAKKSELPTVPTNVSAFTNDAGYLTEHQDISNKQDKVDTRLDLVENITNVVDAINQNNSNTYDKGYEGGYRWDNYMTGSAANCGTDKDPLYNNNLYDIQGTRFDAATQILGADWIIPTTTQWEELIESTTITTVDYPYPMVKFTASNGNSISLMGVAVNGEEGSLESAYSASEIAPARGFREARNCIIDTGVMSMFSSDTPSWTIIERVLSFPLYRYIGVVIRPVTKNASLGVDLGLRSGTRWAATNLTMNGLAATNYDLGDHFAFGELIDKTNGQAPILHINNGSRHITDEERARWNSSSGIINGITSITDTEITDICKI